MLWNCNALLVFDINTKPGSCPIFSFIFSFLFPARNTNTLCVCLVLFSVLWSLDTKTNNYVWIKLFCNDRLHMQNYDTINYSVHSFGCFLCSFLFLFLKFIAYGFVSDCRLKKPKSQISTQNPKAQEFIDICSISFPF